ncbi:MAG: class II aldolase/adducin family protein [Candidatus Andeanibacterium colombiense]|uniref:Class II aldolase/adducin family protein n=1 Tax=Candidatus Andeanibacterium colombiense TaxID=3121345 RepID=A0AAJ5X885_9SPHN|nr:MAG: class II aldolase/adducin family protein [Sphingomonadaceae bacterium]
MSSFAHEAAQAGNIVSSPQTARIKSEGSPAEWIVRVELAAAYRLLDWLGMTDLIHTHLSATVPGEKDRFLLLPYGRLFGEARASEMVKVDPEGGIVNDPTGLGISRGGFCIHAALHLARGESAACVMHAHTEATIAVANYRDGLLPLSQHALRFYRRTAYLDYCGAFDTAEKLARLPRALGESDVLMLRNHGPIVVGPSVRETFSRLYYLERACRFQVASLSQCTDPQHQLMYINREDCEFMANAFAAGGTVVDREWDGLVAMLHRTSPGFDG